MAKKPLRTKEAIAAVPLDQPVDLDVSDDPIVDIVTDDADKSEPKKKVNGAELRAEPPEPDDDAVALRKQLDDLKKAEETARNQAVEHERRAQEAIRRAQELEQQNTQHQGQQLEAEYDSVLNAISASESEANAAQAAYEKAAELGDYKAMGEAQRKISRAEARLESLEQGKGALEARIETAKTIAKDRKDNPLTQDPFENAISALPDPAKNWLRGHREYMTDQRKNLKIQNAHFEVLDDGVTAYSPEYFVAIETKLGLRQAPKADDDDPDDTPPTRRTPVSAPVSREVASPSTGKSTPTKVTLTAEEREMARLSMPNTDPGEAERIYAQQKLKLQQAKNAGHYREN